MADAEREDAYYYPAGIPITPQARRYGYVFPVYVSKTVWSNACVTTGLPSRLGADQERRIMTLIMDCYEGMTKKLATQDDFVFYAFKTWHWDRSRPNAKKQRRARYGARLFLHPDESTPWLYIFDMKADKIEDLTKGEPREEHNELELQSA